MAKFSSVLLNHCLILFLAVSTTSWHTYASVDDERKIYIVYMGSLPGGDYSPTSHHTTILEEILESGSASDALVRSYKRSFNGFAAKLTEAERQRLANRGEVVSIFPSETLQLQTSRSWDFMGLLETSKRNHSVESDTIIGVIDSGIWLDSPSFNDVGFSSPPKKWKGVCAGGLNFTCNNKIIGARYYPGVDDSVIDNIGHGSHTASIAAGGIAKDVSFFGIGKGNARGGVPSARIAIYKVCGALVGCLSFNVLSAFDDAIADGVDIINLSLGNMIPQALTQDTLAIGSFHAMTKNILTTQAAGNNGPKVGSVGSVAPWLFSVAASNTDRRVVSKVILGNNKEFIGSAINSFSLKDVDYPIIFGKDARAGGQCDEKSAMACDTACLEPTLVKGKIVLCTDMLGLVGALATGAAGAIVTYETTDYSFTVPLPASILSAEDFDSVVAYYNSTKTASAIILKGEGLKIGSPPQVAWFSSRGPNRIIPDILKPDISAPGVDIIGAYSMVAPISKIFSRDSRHSRYNILSGTSMACPHVAGVAAYVKTFHPDWSASAIKSAIMTTAWHMNNTNEFAYGSGHIDPVKATDPGLVYETSKEEYIKMLCDIGLNQYDVRKISGDGSTCPKDSAAKAVSFGRELNYPSMTAHFNTSAPFSIKFTRTVSNVGSPRSVYTSRVITRDNKGYKFVIEPSIMSFKSIGEKKTYNVTVTSSMNLTGMFSASLIWSDGVHNVRSPIILYTI